MKQKVPKLAKEKINITYLKTKKQNDFCEQQI